MKTRRELIVGGTAAVGATIVETLGAAESSAILEPPKHGSEEAFDAVEWARSFISHARSIPGLATDEGAMVAWFANAIMEGYDRGRGDIAKEVNNKLLFLQEIDPQVVPR